MRTAKEAAERLKETFKHPRADVEGFLSHCFKWAAPNDTITEQVINWLRDPRGALRQRPIDPTNPASR
jgi:hypothetical protein